MKCQNKVGDPENRHDDVIIIPLATKREVSSVRLTCSHALYYFCHGYAVGMQVPQLPVELLHSDWLRAVVNEKIGLVNLQPYQSIGKLTALIALLSTAL